MDKKELTEEALEEVTGGVDTIEVTIKTLEGENDDYYIKLDD